MVTHTRSRAASASVVMSIRRVGPRRSATRVLGVDQDVEQRLVQQQRIAPAPAAGPRPALRRISMPCRASVALRLASARVSTRSSCDPAARHPMRAGEDEQVPHDLRGAIGFLDRSAAARVARARADADVSISSSRCPSTPCSGLFISCAMPATNCPSDASFSDCARRARSASRSRLEPRLSRDVARDQHAPDRLRVLVDERRRRQQERAAEPRRPRSAACPPGGGPGAGSAVST